MHLYLFLAVNTKKTFIKFLVFFFFFFPGLHFSDQVFFYWILFFPPRYFSGTYRAHADLMEKSLKRILTFLSHYVSYFQTGSLLPNWSLIYNPLSPFHIYYFLIFTYSCNIYYLHLSNEFNFSIFLYSKTSCQSHILYWFLLTQTIQRWMLTTRERLRTPLSPGKKSHIKLKGCTIRILSHWHAL